MATSRVAERCLDDGAVRELLGRVLRGSAGGPRPAQPDDRGHHPGGSTSEARRRSIKVLYSELVVRIMQVLTSLQGLSGQVDDGGARLCPAGRRGSG